MENPLRKQIRSIMKDHKKRQMWYRIVTTLAVVVVFVTTYMLILPAITMENKAECGITEHKHDANCYSSHYEKEKELACTTDSLGVHKHTNACYDAEHKLICGYADFVIHEHDASCYDKDGNLVCTIPEHKLHQHTPECYQMQNTGRRVESISANDSGSTNDTKSANTNHSTTNNSAAANHTARITKTYPRYRRSNRTHRYDDGHSRCRNNGNSNCADSKKRTEKIKFVTKVKYRFFIDRPLYSSGRLIFCSD